MKNFNKLDTAAKVFPSISNKDNSSVFRVSVVLKEEVDEHVLQLALNMIYKRYDTFFLRLRRGVFWEYFDTNYYHCMVEKETDTPCARIIKHENNGYGIKVLYYKSRISVEAFHSITDGSGIIEFLKSLVYYYVCIKYGQINSQSKVLLFDEVTKNDKDSFNEHFNGLAKPKREKFKLSKTPLQISGKKHFKGGHSVVTGTVLVSEIKKYCKENNCTITAFLIANMIFSIYKEKQKRAKNDKAIVVAVPVNLRKIFESNTLKNFFAVVKIGYVVNKETEFTEVLKSVTTQLTQNTAQANLQKTSQQNLQFSNNVFSKHTPLILKNIIIPIGFNYMGDLKKTITLSNVGVMDFPDDMKKYIETTEVLSYPTKKTPINCTICSFDDKLSINFIRSIKDASIIKSFFKGIILHTGAQVSVYSNMWGEENE